MSSAIASKNLYELLGNDPELDPDREPEPPTKVIDKPVQRTGKRNAGAEGPAQDTSRSAAGGRGGSNQTSTRGDQAGSLNNRDDGVRTDRHSNRTREPREYRGGEGRGRGRGRGRGGRGGAPRDDRHSHTGIGEHEKQAAHGWGAQDGNAEWADETAGSAIAQAEAKDDAGFTPDTSAQDPAFSNGPDGATTADDVAAVEAEEKTKSYDQYLAEQAEKKLALGDNISVRKANEGSSTKFPEGKAFAREQEDFFIGGGGKAKKAKDAQDKKERVALDGQYYAAAESGDRGGRGGRGGRGRGRGEFRGGDRGDRGGRGRGRGGDFRGAPRGDRGEHRGGPRGGFNATDESAFPALGA